MDLRPQNWLFPSGQFRKTFVKKNWWGVCPSCQMIKKCYWLIWVFESGIQIRPKIQCFTNLVFRLYFFYIYFFIFLFTNIQIVPKAYLARSSKNMLQVFHKDIANLASPRNSFFFYWEFWVLLQLQWPCRAHKLGQRDFSLLGLSLKCPISCFSPRSCKNGEQCILPKNSVCGLIWVHPIPSGDRG